MISTDDVQKLADLAHLSVSDSDAEQLAVEMEAILAYVQDVKSVVADVRGDTHEKAPLRNVMRDDVVTNEPGQYTDVVVAQFPDRDGTALKVKKIL